MHAQQFKTLPRLIAVLICCCQWGLLAPAGAADSAADEDKPVAAKKSRKAKPAVEEEDSGQAKGQDAPAPKSASARKVKAAKAAEDEPADDAKAPAAKAKSAKSAKPNAENDEAKVIKPTQGEKGDKGEKAENVATTTKGAKSSKADPDAKDERPSKGKREAKAEREDPLDRLRERLAERLGAARANDPNVMRVTASTPATPSAAYAAKGGIANAAPKKRAVAPAHAANAHAPHWAYDGVAGPQSWGGLKAEFAKCSSGERQSPIDIRDGIKVQLDPVQIEYRPSTFRVIDNGHTVQVNLASGNSIEVIGRRYELVQFHFHRPSEERINGRQFEMVVHLVHKDSAGRLAVIAVLLDRGEAHPLVQTVWNNLPLEKGEEIPAKAMLDLNALLPADRSYFTYMGSLTTPPCSEGVLWMVMREPVGVSPEQIGIFSRLYSMNARPIQSASGRIINESN